ncbi:hypothetical protein X750_30825 [Mesorhizobium sp. LNJC394B00]|nr:hypothetical protein X750_30825 [Mesorhizobium sp. LNJC394B00]
MADQCRLLVGWKGKVDDLDLGILDQLFRRVVDGRDVPTRGDLLRIGTGARGDRHHVELRFAIGCQMALGHDHAGADAADTVFFRADLHVRLEAFARHVFLPKFCFRSRDHLANAPPSCPK